MNALKQLTLAVMYKTFERGKCMSKMAVVKKLMAVTVGMSLVLTGCGASGTGGTASKEEPAAQGITADKILVGTTGAQQGALAFIGKPYFDGMKAYFAKVNEAGGIEGRKIELTVLEDEFKPENAIANVQKLINDDKVFSLVGLFGTPGVKASIPTVQESGIPAVYFATGATAPTKAGENFFPVQPNYTTEGKLMAMYANDHFKANKIAVIYQSDDVGLDGLGGFKEGLKAYGADSKLVAELSFDAGATDYTAQVAKAKEAGADLIVCYALSGGVSGVLKEMEKIGLTSTPILVPYPNVSDSFVAANKEAAPKAIENLYGMGWVDMTRPAVQDMVDAVNKYVPGADINAYTISGWIAAETFYKGLEIAVKNVGIDHLSWKAYIEAMGELNYTEGIIPKIAYPNGERIGVSNMCLTEVEGDTWVNKTDYLGFSK